MLSDILEERNRIPWRGARRRRQYAVRGRPCETLRNRLEACERPARAAQRPVRLHAYRLAKTLWQTTEGRTFADINDEGVRTWRHVDPLPSQILDLQAGMIRRLQ